MKKIIHRLLNFGRTDPQLKRFFGLAYRERVAEIKQIYSHDRMSTRMRDFFDEGFDHQENSQHFFDYVAAYALTMKATCLQHIGCFVATDSKFAIDAGFAGHVKATDFDTARLDFLKTEYADGPYRNISFAFQDLENPSPTDFGEADLVVAQAVLSNIQPETIGSLLNAIAASPVRCVLIGDIYEKDSLAYDHIPERPLRSPNDRNWFHPFLALGRNSGFNAFFLPDFTYSSFRVARGIFVLHRNMDLHTHKDAAGLATQLYIDRQERIWKNFCDVDIDVPWKKKTDKQSL